MASEIEDGLETRLLLRNDNPKIHRYHNEITRGIAEFFGSFLLVFVVASLSALNQYSTNGGIGILSFSVAGAFCVTVIIFSIGHISGAHINPCITVGFASAKRFPWSQVPLYVVSQTAGSILATLVAKWMYSYSGDDLALTQPIAGLLQSLVMEIMMTFFIMFLACTLSTNSQLAGNAAAVAVSSGIGLSVMVAGPISGGSLNPARSLGPAIIANKYTHIWIYIVGPLSGSLLAVLAHKLSLHP